MFYSAPDKWSIENFQVGYASSTNGINWAKSTHNPVLPIGSAGKWDRYWASHPGVIYDNKNKKFGMWYTGRDTAAIVSLTGYYWDIGYAESSYIPDTSLTNNNTIDIYPNPGKNNLNIKLPFDLNNAEKRIFNP